jgi:hypothetical protein
MQQAAMSVQGAMHAAVRHGVLNHVAVPEKRAKCGNGDQRAASKKDSASQQNAFRADRTVRTTKIEKCRPTNY